MGSSLEVRPLTPDSLDFSDTDLRTLLLASDPRTSIEADPHEEEPHRAAIPGRPDLLLRWMDIEHPTLLGDSTRRHIEPIEEHVAIYEAELARLGTIIVPVGSEQRRVYIPRHTTFYVPSDPYDDRGMIYTVVERLADTQALPPSGDVEQQDPAFRPFLAALSAGADYYLGGSDTGMYIGEAYQTQQYNSQLQYMDLDPQLVGEYGRQHALERIRNDVSYLEHTAEQHDLQQRLNA